MTSKLQSSSPLPSSPRTSFTSALRRERSGNQNTLARMVRRVARMAKVEARLTPVVSDQEGGGSVAGVMQELPHDIHPGDHAYLSAWHGLFGKHLAMSLFNPDENGPDSVYRFRHPSTDLDIVRHDLTSAGIHHAAYNPKETGTHVVAIDPGRRGRDGVESLGSKLNVGIFESRGQSHYIGGSGPESARKVFRGIIRGKEGDSAFSEPGESDSASSETTGREERAGAGGRLVRGLFYQGGKFLPK